MRIIQVEADAVEKAQSKVAEDLRIKPQDLRFVEERGKKFAFQVLSCPARLDVSISRGGLRAVLNYLYLPIGDNAPPLTHEFVEEELKAMGITYGIKHDVIAKTVFEALHTPGYDAEKLIAEEIAVGVEAVHAQSGKPEWTIDQKLFKKGKPIYVRKGDVLLRARNASKGIDGITVKGEAIKPGVEDTFRLHTGKGVKIEHKEKDTLYVAETFGELINDNNKHVSVERRVIDVNDGMAAAYLLERTNFAGKKIKGSDLLEACKEDGIQKGFLTPEQIESQMEKIKKWPAQVIIARGREPVDGKPGKVTHVYKVAKSAAPLDQERAQEYIVFPEEIIATIESSAVPKDGFTVFGEELRGRAYTELPIYPGRGVRQENREDKIYFISTTYGRASADEDRLYIKNVLQVSKDKMKVALDLFPQQELTFIDLNNLFREADVLFGFDKEKLTTQLQQIHKRGQRVKDFVVAEGKPYTPGKNAKLVYRFNPKDLEPKGMFSSKLRPLFALPGDLLLKKFEPVDAEEGVNVYREKIPVPREKEAKDIEITVGRQIIEKEFGEYQNENDPLRLEYSAATFGTLVWKNKSIDIKPSLQIPEDESSIAIGVASTSDFGGRLSLEMIKKLAEEESVRVDLKTDVLTRALKEPRPEDGSLNYYVIAESTAPLHGEDAQIEYYVEYNEKPIESFVGSKNDEEPKFCDCVRPGDILAKKTPAGNGKDGMSVFGRTLRAERGVDEPWLSGPGTDKTHDGLQLKVSLATPGFVMVEGSRMVVENTVRLSTDKMQAMIDLYPPNSSRFEPKEDKILSMIHGKGVKIGVKVNRIQELVEELEETGKPIIGAVIAEGKEPSVGRDAWFHFAIDTGETVGEMRQDGSMDFKAKSIFHSVKKGQLLLVKHNPTVGEDGQDVLGHRLPGKLGEDIKMNAVVGVETTKGDLEFRASEDGIVEITEKSIRVIPGLLINGDVDYKTGNIEAGKADVFVKGGVVTGFTVTSDNDINIENEAEAAELRAKGIVRVKGGIIGGRERTGLTYSESRVEALYLSSGAVVESMGDVVIGSEVLNSVIKTSGTVICEQGAGTIYGGEIWSYGGVRARVIGAAGAETQTKIHLGLDVFKLKAAELHLEEQGIEKQIKSLTKKIEAIQKDLKSIYEMIPDAQKEDMEHAQKLQAKYKALHERQKEVKTKLDRYKMQKQAIMDSIPRNKNVSIDVLDTVHPGVIVTYGDVEWEIKETMKKVQILWNQATSNIVSKRL